MNMKRTAKFFKCINCNTLVEALNPQCCDEMTYCGHSMEMIIPNRSDGDGEKHMPVVKREGSIITVCVGHLLHPMSREHRIMWIELSGCGYTRRAYLTAGEDPIVSFIVNENDNDFEVYAYCSRHGLWKTTV